MFPVTLTLLLLQKPLVVSSSKDDRHICTEKSVARCKGDVVIAGIFPFYSWEFVHNMNDPAAQQQSNHINLKKYQLLLTLVLAVEEINKNAHLLPNMTIGFEIYSAHYKDTDLLEDPLIWLSGKNKNSPNYTCRRDSKALAVLTGTSSTSVPIWTLLDLYKLPQFTFGSFDPLLSDHRKFGTVYQMAAKDSALALAIVSLMLHFSWTWVGLFITEDDYGVWFLSELREEMDKNGVCLAFENMITYSAFLDFTNDLWMHRQLMESSTNVIIIYGDSKFLLSFILKFGYFLITEKVWVMNSPYDDVTIAKRHFLIDPFHAPLIFSHHHRNTSGFTNFILTEIFSKNSRDNSLPMSWIQSVYCLLVKSDCRDLGHCSYIATLDWMLRHIFDMTMSDESYNIYNAVYAGDERKENYGTQINSDSHSSPDMEQCVRCPDHQLANTERNTCLLKTESFLAYEDPLGMSLACTSLCCSVLTAAVLGVFIKHQDTPIVKANNRALSYILLISLICCFLCSLLFLGRPHTATCILQHTTFAVVFTVAVSTVLAKTITVVLAFTLTAPGRSMRQWLQSRAPNLIIPICTLIQVTLCGLWLGISPPFVDTDVHSEHGHVIILCNMGSLSVFYCVLGYLGFLALASFTVSFLARNLPDTFNEAKFLTFSMLVFCSVWLTFLPVYHSTKGKVIVAMEVFSILASSGGLLGCIFAPKCYIILLRPERNSLSRFRESSQSGRNRH
ncbi:PREDICTED: vomeronasal type-2 receptor 116-like [Dipodomys ordii]|uniref:Vomeronasal type-2 receptor 116-like n=1 Tax=Dipodomys ordii TaxID=10020 RepID=A0A1S3GRQ1_DIPOR|nr:PREDICTED: vomeronasal type-2 receptor 116-like [Dipodomys ordii]